MTASKKVTEKADLDVFDPQPVVHKIGNKEFEQMPLYLSDMGNLLGIFYEVINIASSSDALAEFTNIDLTSDEGRAQAAPAMFNLLGMVPSLLPTVVAACLRVTAPEDIELIRTRCRPVTLLRIIDTFIEQNEPEELMAAFLALKARFLKVKTLMT